MYQKIKNWIALNENKLKSQNKDDDEEKKITFQSIMKLDTYNVSF